MIRKRTSDDNTDKAVVRIGNFELMRLVGEGAMGDVYLARQRSLDRLVAVKILKEKYASNSEFIKQFQREARFVAKLNHPNIVQGIDVGQDKSTGKWYFAMEYVDGPTAGQVLKAEGPLLESTVLDITRQMAEALDCADSHGLVHRDVKPDNIILLANGEAKLLDLGLAGRFQTDVQDVKRSKKAIGTPYYMAPEQAKGQIDRFDIRTDIYSLGATLFHLAAGRPAFQGETSQEVMVKHVKDEAPKAHEVCEGISSFLGELIFKMMQKKREDRIQSPKELLKLLNKAAQHTSSVQVRSIHRGQVTRTIRSLRKKHGGRKRRRSIRSKVASRLETSVESSQPPVLSTNNITNLSDSGEKSSVGTEVVTKPKRKKRVRRRRVRRK